MASIAKSRSFWNQRAKENPYWYVSSCGPYENRDLEGFWFSGFSIWEELKKAAQLPPAFPQGEIYQPLPTDVAVEIGCGVGRITRAIAREVGEVHAFDISREMVEIARKSLLPNAVFKVNSGTSLELPDSVADVVVAYCVFQHLPDLATLRGYLQEIRRIARPGAAVFFTTCPRDWKDLFQPLMQLKAMVKEKLGLQPPGLHTKAWLGIRPSQKQVESLCPFPIYLCPLDNSRWFYFGYVVK